jgi:hypothetical protein
MGLNAIKTPFSRGYNTKIYKNLRDLVYDEKLEIFKHEKGIKELKNLQERRVGKKQMIVEAPTQGEITTDDLADVLANSCFIATSLELGYSNTALGICGTNGYETFKSSTSYRATSSHAYRRRLQLHKTTTNFELARRAGAVK